MLQELLPPFLWLLELAAVALTVGGAWRTFEKVGQPGWTALVPFWNAVVLARVSRRREWIPFLFVPCVNLFFFAGICVSLARRFGKGTAFGLGLVVLPFVFWPLLGASSLESNRAAPAPGVA